MKDLFLILGLVCCCIVLSVVIATSQDASQNSAQNSMHVDPYHCWYAGAAANATDSLVVIHGGNDHTDPFRHWENSVVHMYVVGADSVKFFVDLMQYSYAPTSTAADTAKYVLGHTLSWSNADSTSIDTIEASGYYMATLSRAIDDTLGFAALWDLIRTRPITGNTQEAGNHAIFVITGREKIVKEEQWRR